MDEYYLSLALQQARIAEDAGEVPVGAVLVNNDTVIAAAHNRPIAANDATAHAEINVIRQAGQTVGNYRLTGATVYVTLEPCVMCMAALLHARVARLVFGAADPQRGAAGGCFDFAQHPSFNHHIVVTGGVLADECRQLLQDFFKRRR